MLPGRSIRSCSTKCRIRQQGCHFPQGNEGDRVELPDILDNEVKPVFILGSLTAVKDLRQVTILHGIGVMVLVIFVGDSGVHRVRMEVSLTISAHL